MWMDNFVLNMPKEFWPKFNNHPILFRFFESKAKVVVLSASNRAEIETHEKICQAKKIPILKRKGGGGCVVLGPGCLILTLAFYAKNIYGNREYFELINSLWIESLEAYGMQNLSQNGISDICIGEKKVAGTSIFRKKNLLVYQGSLLVKPDFHLISELLRYPSRAPDYRAGRTHSDFLTCLVQHHGRDIDMQALEKHCFAYFEKHVGIKLGSECLDNEFT